MQIVSSGGSAGTTLAGRADARSCASLASSTRSSRLDVVTDHFRGPGQPARRRPSQVPAHPRPCLSTQAGLPCLGRGTVGDPVIVARREARIDSGPTVNSDGVRSLPLVRSGDRPFSLLSPWPLALSLLRALAQCFASERPRTSPPPCQSSPRSSPGPSTCTSLTSTRAARTCVVTSESARTRVTAMPPASSSLVSRPLPRSSRLAAGVGQERLADLAPLLAPARSDAIAFLGEFAGTTLFCFFAFAGTTVASLPATSVTDSGATANQGAVQPSPNTSSCESQCQGSRGLRRL